MVNLTDLGDEKEVKYAMKVLSMDRSITFEFVMSTTTGAFRPFKYWIGHHHPCDIVSALNGIGYSLKSATSYPYSRNSPYKLGKCKPDAARDEVAASRLMLPSTTPGRRQSSSSSSTRAVIRNIEAAPRFASSVGSSISTSNESDVLSSSKLLQSEESMSQHERAGDGSSRSKRQRSEGFTSETSAEQIAGEAASASAGASSAGASLTAGASLAVRVPPIERKLFAESTVKKSTRSCGGVADVATQVEIALNEAATQVESHSYCESGTQVEMASYCDMGTQTELGEVVGPSVAQAQSPMKRIISRNRPSDKHTPSGTFVATSVQLKVLLKAIHAHGAICKQGALVLRSRAFRVDGLCGKVTATCELGKGCKMTTAAARKNVYDKSSRWDNSGSFSWRSSPDIAVPGMERKMATVNAKFGFGVTMTRSGKTISSGLAQRR
jgi:hypothetical protein